MTAPQLNFVRRPGPPGSTPLLLIHSLGGTYGYDISVNRMVAVDVRAITHTLDVVYGARRVLEELTSVNQR